jgi:hypothetical protein
MMERNRADSLLAMHSEDYNKVGLGIIARAEVRGRGNDVL